MNLLKNTFTWLLILGFLSPCYAAIGDVEISSCAVFNDDKGSGGDKKGGGSTDEEPDCE